VTSAARVVAWRGAAAVELTAGDYRAVVVPELAMLVASVQWCGRELVALPGGLAAYRAGHTTGIPLLHPWANRLARRRYDAAGTAVDLRRLALHTDGNGLPIHGTMTARPGWDVLRLEGRGARARVDARFPFGDHADLLASFPFPHDLGVSVRLGPDGLHVVTTVHATGGVGVPISFGWHPYWRLGSARAGWRLHRPAGEQLVLDRRGIPTGRRRPVAAESDALGARALDDAFALGPVRTFVLADRRTALRIAFDASYPYAQVYSPAGSSFCAIEPMTAPTNALGSGDHPTLAPGATFTAGFRAVAAAVSG
jgi:galactose mutarotase-like enzyme